MWQPEHRCENRTAPRCSVFCDVGTEIFIVPQAAANTATAANALEMRNTLNGRLMRAEIIIGIGKSGARASILGLIVACAGLLAGCGHTRVVSAGQTLHIAVSEYRLNPQDVRTTPGNLTIVISNVGHLTHNLVITRDGQTTASTNTIWPGQTTYLTTYLSPGTYSIASTLVSDQLLGTYGKLTVSG